MPSAIRYWNELLLVMILILMNAFFSASEMALVSVRKHRLTHLRDGGDRRAAKALRLVEDPARFLTTIQVGITLLGFLASAAAAVSVAGALASWIRPLLGASSGPVSVAAVASVVSIAMLIMGELLPKRIALYNAERVALAVAPSIHRLAVALAPLVRLLTAVTNLVARGLGIPSQADTSAITEEEIRSMVEAHRDLADEEKEMIHGVFEFGDRLVRDIMTHRADMVCVSEDMPLSEFPTVVSDHGFSRYPVFSESLENITGYLSVKDCLLICSIGESQPLTAKDIKRDATFVPETKKAADLFRMFREQHIALALAVDEYGETAGLVTLEDLVEQIVGELEDEFKEGDQLQRVNTGEVVVSGRIGLAEVGGLLSAAIPEGPYETLAGFCLVSLGHIPKAGESFRWADFSFRVDEMEGRRIMRVRIKRV